MRNSYRWFLKSPTIGWLLPQLWLPRLNSADQGLELITEERQVQISIFDSSCKSVDTVSANAAAAGVGILFGAVHCVAWNFQFLTPQEQTLWRMWSGIITATPFVLCVWRTIAYVIYRAALKKGLWSGPSTRRLRALKFLMGIHSWISMPIIVVLPPVYVIGRVGLLVQALIALRDLQPSERAEVRWVDCLPHL